MSLCAACGLQLTGDATLCPHHPTGYEKEWAEHNRLVCNGIHRGAWESRLSPAEREAFHAEAQDDMRRAQPVSA